MPRKMSPPFSPSGAMAQPICCRWKGSTSARVRRCCSISMPQRKRGAKFPPPIWKMTSPACRMSRRLVSPTRILMITKKASRSRRRQQGSTKSIGVAARTNATCRRDLSPTKARRGSFSLPRQRPRRARGDMLSRVSWHARPKDVVGAAQNLHPDRHSLREYPLGGSAKQIQHRQIRVRVPAVSSRVNHYYAGGAKQHVARPQITMDASRGHIKFGGIGMLDDVLARLFHLLQNLRGKVGPARKGQHALLGIKFCPLVRRRTGLLNASDIVFARPAFRCSTKSLSPGVMNSAQNFAERKR